MKSDAYYKGYDAKKEEIDNMGFAAARDKFNAENPVGKPWVGSVEGLQYAHGEMQALVDVDTMVGEVHPLVDSLPKYPEVNPSNPTYTGDRA